MSSYGCDDEAPVAESCLEAYLHTRIMELDLLLGKAGQATRNVEMTSWIISVCMRLMPVSQGPFEWIYESKNRHNERLENVL